jgi:hypothetical protein
MGVDFHELLTQFFTKSSPGATLLISAYIKAIAKPAWAVKQHKLAERLFAEVGRVLRGRGMTLKTGAIVDATIIAAPSATKNAETHRTPEMHQTRIGKQWCASRTQY